MNGVQRMPKTSEPKFPQSEVAPFMAVSQVRELDTLQEYETLERMCLSRSAHESMVQTAIFSQSTGSVLDVHRGVSTVGLVLTGSAKAEDATSSSTVTLSGHTGGGTT
jgi:hypothetical protein